MVERYAIRHDESGGEAAWVLTDSEAGAEALVLPGRGNNVTHFRVQLPDREHPFEVLVPPQPPQGLGARGSSAGNPILFPFPNRVQSGRYTFEGKTYQADVNESPRGHHIHGFVSNLPWTVEEQGASEQAGAWQRASVELSSFPEVARQYPFPCYLTVLTRLLEGVLIQEIAVQNTGQMRLPMGYGTHPWFHSAVAGGRREATLVRVPANHYWELNDRMPTGRIRSVDEPPADYDLCAWRGFGDADFDDVWTDLIRRDDGWSEAGIRYPNVGLEIRMEASPEFREWVVFSPRSRPVICLEPYTCTTNAVNLQQEGIDAGLIVLEPGAVWTATLRMSLHREKVAE